MADTKIRDGPESDTEQPGSAATAEYCAKLQQWMWQYYWGYASWQSWVALSAFSFPPPLSFPPPGIDAQTPGTPASTAAGTGQQVFDTRSWYSYYPFAASFPPLPAGTEQSSATSPPPSADARPGQQQNGNPPQAGRAQLQSMWPNLTGYFCSTSVLKVFAQLMQPHNFVSL